MSDHAARDKAAFAADRGWEGADVRVRLSDDHKRLVLLDGDAERDIKLARNIWLYDPAAYAFQVLDAGRLLLSATVDPVNPEAVARKKADPDVIDFYLVDRHSGEARRVLQLDGKGRPSGWRAGGGRLALLRKSKGFDRGGVALEVYPLALDR
jgi:hypothetical protein